MQFVDHIGLSVAVRGELERRLDGLGMLSDVVRWLPHVGAAIVDVVVQDEFTHDVVVSHAPHYLVFDTT